MRAVGERGPWDQAVMAVHRLAPSGQNEPLAPALYAEVKGAWFHITLGHVTHEVM